MSYTLLAVQVLNNVELIGRVGADPEQRFMPAGGLVINLSLATTRRWKNRETGERVEETEWHRVVCFGKLAEIIGEYVKKGRLIRISGRIKTRKWSKDGVDHYSTEIIAEDMLMLGSRAEAQGQSGGGSGSHTTRSGQVPPEINPGADSASYFDDDVPF